MQPPGPPRTTGRLADVGHGYGGMVGTRLSGAEPRLRTSAPTPFQHGRRDAPVTPRAAALVHAATVTPHEVR